MDGLLIDEQLRALTPLLPAERLAWRFPDDRTAVLPLTAGGALWLNSRPPRPYLLVRPDYPAPSRALTPFQQQLAARAAGPLTGATQAALDRVVTLAFGTAPGFVPTPGVDLVVELTGRNANLLLVEGRRIVGVERQVLADRNRYRELKVGGAYAPPPPYRKADPRSAGPAALAGLLEGRTLADVPRLVDGIGPELAAALRDALAAAGSAPDTALGGAALAAVIRELAALVARPSAYLARWTAGADADARAAADAQRLARQRERLGRHFKKELTLARRRLADADAALAAGAAARELRAEADLLLARVGEVPPGAARVRLAGWGSEVVDLDLDPRRSVAANAAARYDQARRREARAERAAEGRSALLAAVTAAENAVAGLAELPPGAVAEALAIREVAGGAAAGRGPGRRPATPGITFQGPHGFEVVVGRNARDNDRVTFALAKSRDLWLHAQGYRGSHVIVRSAGREVPFETLLFAARLAAGHSEARREARVAVDYTERKNVWRRKGAAPGAVEFAHHKTVLVAPARDDEGARGEEPAT